MTKYSFLGLGELLMLLAFNSMTLFVLLALAFVSLFDVLLGFFFFFFLVSYFLSNSSQSLLESFLNLLQLLWWMLMLRKFKFTSSTSISLCYHQPYFSSMHITWRWTQGTHLFFFITWVNSLIYIFSIYASKMSRACPIAQPWKGFIYD